MPRMQLLAAVRRTTPKRWLVSPAATHAARRWAPRGLATVAATDGATGAAERSPPDEGGPWASAKRDVFGLGADRPLRPSQRRAIEAALEGRCVLLIMGTGGGKSLAFQLPAVLPAPAGGGRVTVVIEPLLAVIQDQVTALRAKGVSVAPISSVSSAEDRARALRGVADGALDLLYVTPEGLAASKALQEALEARPPRRFVFDEAHCIVHWGDTFREAYADAARFVTRRFPDVPWTLVTATAPLPVRERLLEIMRAAPDDACGGGATAAPPAAPSGARPVRVIESQEADRSNLSLRVVNANRCTEKARTAVTAELIRRARGSSLVFVLSRADAESVSAQLNGAGLQTAALHGDMPGKTRARLLAAWLSGALPTLVATTALSMGVDNPNVRLVVHFSPPLSMTMYVQQVGRAGRDQRPAECVLFASVPLLRAARELANRDSGSMEELHAVEQLVSVSSPECPRQAVTRFLYGAPSPPEDVPSACARNNFTECGCRLELSHLATALGMRGGRPPDAGKVVAAGKVASAPVSPAGEAVSEKASAKAEAAGRGSGSKGAKPRGTKAQLGTDHPGSVVGEVGEGVAPQRMDAVVDRLLTSMKLKSRQSRHKIPTRHALRQALLLCREAPDEVRGSGFVSLKGWGREMTQTWGDLVLEAAKRAEARGWWSES